MGGIVLTALVTLTCISVVGRGLNRLGHSDLMEGLAPGLAAWLVGTGVGPIPGDYELVEAGIAFAVFAFLPICQLYAAHATVDVFAGMMPRGVNRFLTAFWEVMLAVVIIVIGWRLYAGFTEKLANGQTTFLLQFPVWWAYGASPLSRPSWRGWSGSTARWRGWSRPAPGAAPCPAARGRSIERARAWVLVLSGPADPDLPARAHRRGDVLRRRRRACGWPRAVRTWV